MKRIAYAVLGSTMVAAALIACGGNDSVSPPARNPPGTPTAVGSTPTMPTTTPTAPPVASVVTPPAPTGATPAANAAPWPVIVHGSGMAKDLQDLGFDIKKLPTFAKMDPVKKLKVMNTFTKSLGVKCSGCHVENPKAETPNKKVARKMWDQWVVGLQLEDNTFLYCDSCHQGHEQFLDHHDKKALSAWMQEQLVAKIKRTDKKDHDCGTCHGDPFDGDFLEAWKKK